MLHQNCLTLHSINIDDQVVYCVRPVVVSFEELTAREEVLQKAGMLKGSNIFITEDLSRLSHLVEHSDICIFQDHERHQEGVGKVHENHQERKSWSSGPTGV